MSSPESIFLFFLSLSGFCSFLLSESDFFFAFPFYACFAPDSHFWNFFNSFFSSKFWTIFQTLKLLWTGCCEIRSHWTKKLTVLHYSHFFIWLHVIRSCMNTRVGGHTDQAILLIEKAVLYFLKQFIYIKKIDTIITKLYEIKVWCIKDEFSSF